MPSNVTPDAVARDVTTAASRAALSDRAVVRELSIVAGRPTPAVAGTRACGMAVSSDATAAPHTPTQRWKIPAHTAAT